MSSNRPLKTLSSHYTGWPYRITCLDPFYSHLCDTIDVEPQWPEDDGPVRIGAEACRVTWFEKDENGKNWEVQCMEPACYSTRFGDKLGIVTCEEHRARSRGM